MLEDLIFCQIFNLASTKYKFNSEFEWKSFLTKLNNSTFILSKV